MNIVPYREEYRESLREICALTGPPEAVYDEKMNRYITNMYCNYYLDNEQENVFVLVDDCDSPKGYILCAPDNKKYRRGMKKYFRAFKDTGFANNFEAVTEFLTTCLFSVKYPAHLHIDIVNGYLRQGLGTSLMKTLLSHLENTGVRGVMLIVGTGNVEAISFYKKMGFDTLVKTRTGTVMGKKITHKE